MKRAISFVIWTAVALLGALGYATLAIRRGEHVSSGWLLLAAVCTYTIGYRFYSKWGVPGWDILKISLFQTITYLLGALSLLYSRIICAF